MNEFELINRFFTRPVKDALVGNGDDAAIVAPTADHAFVVTTDSLIEGRHFLPTLDPLKLGRRLVHVNLSDLAAMGASPRYAMLSLALPRIDETWVSRFAEGFWAALDEFGIGLVGGNTTRGALALSITAFGEVPVVSGRANAMLRSGAKAGDEVWVSGELGGAGWALGCMTGEIEASATREQIAAYEAPTARVALGISLRAVATSCIDISDGLLSEANHLARASHVSLALDFASIPTSLGDVLADAKLRAQATQTLLTTGDAYELLFTASRDRHEDVRNLLAHHGLRGARIGTVHAASTETQAVSVIDSAGRMIEISAQGWDHFA